ncbi:unnamed protein product [Ilex paraguariensis]|uniref:VQ domain-containing protein n=1 Tax=Ilex paraguariensis TaxID=185542 RepID=A0ABC8SSV0_9AQUA
MDSSAGKSMSGGTREPVKVVIINTQYIETDAVSFKSVVQRLTGKDSIVEVESSSSTGRKTSRVGAPAKISGGDSFFSKELSFKDFDRLLMEMPPLEELYRLCAD